MRRSSAVLCGLAVLALMTLARSGMALAVGIEETDPFEQIYGLEQICALDGCLAPVVRFRRCVRPVGGDHRRRG